ncbi:MAG: hypothetical protein QOG83_2217, partial [Alphaproteobacteria bacterium]|nr:hypothetical protein [Alphaproteobacteria bacterium]
DWQAVEGQPGLSERRLAVLSERQLQLSMFKLEPNARGALRSRGGVHVGFVVEGGGAANGAALRKYSAFSGNEDLMLSAPGGMEFLLVGLPIFKAPAALLAAE